MEAGCIFFWKVLSCSYAFRVETDPRCWNAVLDDFLQQQGLNLSGADHCIYIKDVTDVKIIRQMYVDNLRIVSTSESEMSEAKKDPWR